MKKIVLSALVAGVLFSCGEKQNEELTSSPKTEEQTDDFNYEIERFADIRILSYQIKGFDNLTLQQKKLAYYLTQAGLAGRDIIYDQNYKHNLEIRRALDNIVANHEGDESEDWNKFLQYTKQVWFANGIHHHYSKDKFKPEFDQTYFNTLLTETNTELSKEADRKSVV